MARARARARGWCWEVLLSRLCSFIKQGNVVVVFPSTVQALEAGVPHSSRAYSSAVLQPTSSRWSAPWRLGISKPAHRRSSIGLGQSALVSGLWQLFRSLRLPRR